MASGYSFSSTTDPDNNTLAYDKNGRLKIISVPPVDVSVTNPITNDNNTLGLNYDNVTLNLSSGTGAPLQINLANANTWTASQTFPGAIVQTSGLHLHNANSSGIGFEVNGSTTWYAQLDSSNNLFFASINSNTTFYIETSAGTQVFIVNPTSKSVTTANNTLDNGSGNATFTASGAGIVSANGIKTTAGAATAVTVGASPYTYTNSSASNQQIFIQGGTVSAISFNPNGGTGIALSAFTDNIMVMRPNDALTITYTSAPTVNTIQL